MNLLGPRPPIFHGHSYRAEFDKARLTTALHRVLFALLDGRKWTQEALRAAGGGEAPDSRVRQLRNQYRLPIPDARRINGRESSGIHTYQLEVWRLHEHPEDESGRIRLDWPTHAESVREILGLAKEQAA